MRRLLAASLVLIAACTKGQGFASGPDGGGKVCRQMGCVSGLRIGVAKAGAWQPGTYAFSFDLDGAPVRCTGALPLRSCDAGPSVTCDVEGRVQLGESGCALPPAEQGFGDFQVQGAPAKVKVAIAREGQELVATEFTPTYAESRPNGPGCEPVCHGAAVELRVP